MRAHGPARVAVAVCVAVALCAFALVAAPARPALAAAIDPVNPGGDLTVSVPLGPVPASFMSQVVSTTYTSFLGLTTGSSTSLAAMMTASYNQDSGAGSGAAPPPVVSDTGTVTVSSTTQTLDETMPAADIPSSNAPGGPRGPEASVLSSFITNVVKISGLGLCLFYNGIRKRQAPITAPPTVTVGEALVCGAFADTWANITAYALNDLWSGSAPKGTEWAKILAFGLTNIALGFGSAKWLIPLMEKYLVGFGAVIGRVVQSAFTNDGAWLGPPPGDVNATASAADTAYSFAESINQQGTTATMNSVFAANGFPTMVAEGPVIDTALGTPAIQCMDAYQAAGLPVYGDPVAINVCSSNVTSDQDWIKWSNNTLTNGGLCLDITNAKWSRSAPLELYGCNGQWNQNWSQRKTGRGTPFVQNDPGGTGACVDDPAFDTSPGTQLIDWTCSADTNQQWELPGYDATSTSTGPTATGYGPVGSGLSGECMDAYGSSNGASPGQIVAINGCNGNQAQEWTPWSDGTVTAWGLCLDTNGGTSAAGTPLVDLGTCSGAASQVWAQQPDGALLNTASRMCLDDPASSTAAGTQLQLYGCNGGANQVWTLPPGPVTTPLPPLPPNASVCDIYASGGTPCAAAYSMDRALYVGYNGPLYQVKRVSDNTTQDIGLLSAGGDVNAGEQDSFCAGTTCTVTKIYDQSPNGNNLTVFTAGGGANHNPDPAADAGALPIKIGANGSKAYGLDIENGTGYRLDTTKGIATGSQPEGMYMVASGTHVNSGCCFDFGNVETTNNDDNAGAMDAVNLTTYCGNNNSSPCDGPWVMDDMENGQWTGAGPNPEQPSSSNFVTAMLKNNGTSEFALQSGASTSGGLTKWYDGPLPGGYDPMRKEGAIVLGTGGDNSNSDVGSFFEGVMTQGYPSDATDASVQANIVAAGYSGTTSPATSAAASPAGQAVVHSAGATGQGAAGFSSVFTVDSANGHLQESYLPFMGDSWSTHDLSSTAPTMPDTPPVMAGTKPVALVHCGYTSVFTVDTNGDLQETYLSAIGQSWATQDLSAEYQHTPPTNVTPTAVEYSSGVPGGSASCGYTSVFTRDRNGDLQETYLPNAGFPGDAWLTHDLSSTAPTMAGTPEIQTGTSPVALVHCGYTSVYTVNASNHLLQETYLPAFGDSWSTQTLNAPPTVNTPTAVMHSAGVPGGTADCGYTSVFTVDDVTRHLQETYLPNIGFPGDAWLTHDLSSTAPTMADTPAVAPGTQPEVLVHMGFTSVYTVDEGSQHLQETYLPAFGDSWSTQDLTANPQYNAPLTDQSPIVLLHPDASGNMDWASVFTVDEFTNDLEETYLPNTGFPGDPWHTQDLSSTAPTMPNTPPVAVQQSSQATWSLAHDEYTSAFTVDSNGDLQESYLAAMGGAWATHDLSSSAPNMAGTPAVAPFTAPISLYHQGYASVFTVDASNGDLQETFLEALGGPWYTHDLSASTMASTPTVAPGTGPSAVFHDGYASVFTIDAGSGDLQETFLEALGGAWYTHDLSSSAMAGTPPAAAGTSPVAIVHDGYTSVFTIDTSGHLWETYLPVLGGPWHSHDLTAMTQGPAVAPATSPTAVYHDGFTSVYTVDANPGHASGDLQETYLPAIGDSWVTQDLTAKYSLPPATQGDDPVALYHTGFTSVYFPDGRNGDLDEFYLPAISDGWGWNDMTYNYHTPKTGIYPSPLVHYDVNGALTWTSVFTADVGSGDLRETYLPAIGDNWTTQDLTQKYPGIPPW